ncbi:transcriptional regulator [Microbacterium saperdae]|uniref:Winged helix DNA-binding protein n=1 Tax=Microbacterium saperdae TaxID=69368 RepID=A0A543BN44_9MICO|nr:transcriptional regulator [Microbacterium saperdae]TQL86244.1 winged helix DNA-binding protein [Microbacterium saperdae]GGM49496.1 transcriptional regulator [Microbacterium saperdae]
MASAEGGERPVDPAFSDVVHSPVRLQVCAALAAGDRVLFAELLQALGVTDSHLSKNVRVLADAGLVELHKVAPPAGGGVRPVTALSLTSEGADAYQGHAAWLQSITHAPEKGNHP